MWPPHDKTEELLKGVRTGDEDAVNRLIERHRAAVLRLVQLRLDNRVRRRVGVSDVVQDVFLEANRRLGDYLANPTMPFHLWLRHIAQDRIIDAHRRHRGSQKRSVDRELGLVAPGGNDRSTLELAERLCDRQLTPAAAATQQEMAKRVEAAIAELDEQDREIIVMRHYEQLSNQDVARVLGLTEPAASMRHLRAVRRLRAVLLDSNADRAT